MEIIISEVVDKDIPEIQALAKITFKKNVFPNFTEEGRNSLLLSFKIDIPLITDTQKCKSLKATIGSEIAGYVVLKNGRKIQQFCVLPEHQGKGIGTELLNEVVKYATTNTVKLDSSVNAVEFYKKKNFIPVGQEQEIAGIRFVPMEYQICA